MPNDVIGAGQDIAQPWDTLNVPLQILSVVRNYPIGRQRSGSAQQAILSAGSGFGNPSFKGFRLSKKNEGTHLDGRGIAKMKSQGYPWSYENAAHATEHKLSEPCRELCRIF